MTKFIFFGRLVHEKGIDMIIDSFSMLYKEGITDRHLDIYGIGVYDKACEAFAKMMPENVTFHGWGDHELVMKVLQGKDFCLMPSLVIETFGLTALESLRAGAPVIGFKKGGTEPFISNQLNIDAQIEGDQNAHETKKSYTEKLYHLIKHILLIKQDKSIYMPAIDLNQYTPEIWMNNFKKMAGNAKRILLVSDFIKKVGGVENYIWDVKELLQSHGYEVVLRGSDKKNSFRGLFKTAFNVTAWRKLRRKIREFQPDLVRCHSVMRELGWLPLSAIPKKIPLWMMFHDMGYFVPHPSRLFQINHVPESMGLIRWIKLGHTNNPVKRILLTLKRISLHAINTTLRSHHTTYLVPSPFMKPFIENTRKGKQGTTIVLPHFVR